MKEYPAKYISTSQARSPTESHLASDPFFQYSGNSYPSRKAQSNPATDGKSEIAYDQCPPFQH